MASCYWDHSYLIWMNVVCSLLGDWKNWGVLQCNWPPHVAWVILPVGWSWNASTAVVEICWILSWLLSQSMQYGEFLIMGGKLVNCSKSKFLKNLFIILNQTKIKLALPRYRANVGKHCLKLFITVQPYFLTHRSITISINFKFPNNCLLMDINFA